MLRWLTVFLSLSFGAYAAPAPPECQGLFYNGNTPDVDEAHSNRTHTVCYSHIMVLASGETKTPLWSAEHLTKDKVVTAKTLVRKNTFHAESGIPAEDRAELSDYLHSKHDRGHLSPSDDMPDTNGQFESFALANMVPQNPCNNEIIWKAIEGLTRKYVLDHDDVFVITGPIFEDPQATIGNGVHVPTKIWKAVYDPHANTLLILDTVNQNVQTYETLSREQLQAATGVSVFSDVQSPGPLALDPLPKLSGSCKKGE